MPFVGLSILLQVFCAVHIVRTGRNSLWLWVVVLLSIPGCIAYFAVELAPELLGTRTARRVRQATIKAIDPERELREARDRLALADTAENRLRLGDALVEMRRFGEAVPHYEAALASAPSGDWRISIKLANACFEIGQAERTLMLIDAIPTIGSSADADRVAMLRARALEHIDRRDEALRIYEDLSSRYPGEEARCRFAHLLIEAGQTARAIVVLQEIRARMQRASREQRRAEQELYDWAAGELKRLTQRG